MTVRLMVWHRYRAIVVPSYVRESDIFATTKEELWRKPKPEYAWIMMKALLLFKLERKDKPWMCGEGTLQRDIDYIQEMMDSEVK